MLSRTLKWIRDIRRYNRARLRMLDVDTLWPSLVRQAPSLNHAKNAFLVHAQEDPAWTTDMSFREISDFVEVMEAPKEIRWPR